MVSPLTRIDSLFLTNKGKEASNYAGFFNYGEVLYSVY